MNASAPVVPYGRNALLTHAAAVVLGVASAVGAKYLADPAATVCSIMGVIACGVIWSWSMFLALRSLRFENRHRCAWAAITLSLTEIVLPCIPPWLYIFQFMPNFILINQTYHRLMSLLTPYALPVFVPFLVLGSASAIALSGWITRHEEKRWTRRRGRWAVYPFIAMVFAVLPWPLFLFCGVMGNGPYSLDFSSQIAQSMPDFVKDGVAACLYSPAPGRLRSIHDILFARRLVSRKYVVALTEKKLAEFRANPSQPFADELARMLSQFILPKEQGSEVLKALAMPAFLSRASYAIGTRASFAVKLPRNIRLSNGYPTVFCSVHVDGLVTTVGFNEADSGLSSSPRVVETSEPLLRAGAHHVTITYTYQFNHSWMGAATYEFSTTHSVDVQAVPRGSEEKVQLVSNPTLDASMLAAFSTPAGSFVSSQYVNGKRVEIISTFEVVYSALPENALFTITYQDSSGKKTKLNTTSLNPGSVGNFHLDVGPLFSEQPGTYTGTLLLEADPDAAIPHADIKQIWNGKITLPYTFTVRIRK